jgi:predicted nucleotidyltransferase
MLWAKIYGTFVAAWRGVGISFFRLPLYPLVLPTVDIESVPLASIEEIGAMKLAAVIDRGTRKDLVDLYFILRAEDEAEVVTH